MSSPGCQPEGKLELNTPSSKRANFIYIFIYAKTIIDLISIFDYNNYTKLKIKYFNLTIDKSKITL